MGDRPRRTVRWGPVMLLLGGAVLLALASTALADDDPQPVDLTHNVTNAPAPVAGAVFGSGPAVKTGTAICTTPSSQPGGDEGVVQMAVGGVVLGTAQFEGAVGGGREVGGVVRVDLVERPHQVDSEVPLRL